MDKDELDAYVKAGKIAATALRYGAGLIKVGESVLEVTEKVEEKILELGGEFAFPPQISLNDTAAHYCSPIDDKTIFKEGDVAKLDCGVHIKGFVADNAVTVVLSDDPKLKLLGEASKVALQAALKVVRPGVNVREIGAAIEKEITARGFNPVVNLSGHGLAKFVIHDSPSIPNIEAGNAILKEGQAIAIEPFASTGAGMIYEGGNPTIHSLTETKPVRSPMTREVLKTIHEYQGLPFASRWLVKKHGLGKTMFALKELRSLGILNDYPPLPDRSHGIVSQHEHTILVLEKPVVTTLLEE